MPVRLGTPLSSDAASKPAAMTAHFVTITLGNEASGAPARRRLNLIAAVAKTSTEQ
jgi:hypothetical protein